MLQNFIWGDPNREKEIIIMTIDEIAVSRNEFDLASIQRREPYEFVVTKLQVRDTVDQITRRNIEVLTALRKTVTSEQNLLTEIDTKLKDLIQNLSVIKLPTNSTEIIESDFTKVCNLNKLETEVD